MTTLWRRFRAWWNGDVEPTYVINVEVYRKGQVIDADWTGSHRFGEGNWVWRYASPDLCRQVTRDTLAALPPAVQDVPPFVVDETDPGQVAFMRDPLNVEIPVPSRWLLAAVLASG